MLVVIGITAFIILCLKKWGITQYLQENFRLLGKWASCDLCMAFWISLIVSLGLFFIHGSYEVLFYPIICTPFIRFIL